MEKIKISTLPKDTIVFVEGATYTMTVEEVLEDLESYRDEEIYTTTPDHASFNAESIIDSAIENVYCNGMYEDWDEIITRDVTKKDIEEMQAIFDRILARNPNQNICYAADKPIEIDV